MTQVEIFRDAKSLAAPFPALLASAQHLASTLMLGEHGRRRAGMGDAFWQFRNAQTGDSLRAIDWRRSAMADEQFVRETEWQTAQTVQFWVDTAASMDFTSGDETKGDRAQILALALAILLSHGGERIGSADGSVPPKTGRAQVAILAQHFHGNATDADFGTPNANALVPNSHAVFLSDFFGNFEKLQTAVTAAADRGVSGVLMMILDPQEMSFPFHGRTIFESMGGALRHETKKAGDLKQKYLAELETRQSMLRHLAKTVNWQTHVHVTDQSPQSALLWLHQAIGSQR